MRAARLVFPILALATSMSCSGGGDPPTAGPTILITVTPTNPIVEVGQQIQLTATVTGPPGIARTVVWSSRTTEIVTVSGTGLVNGVAEGAGTVRAAWVSDTLEFTDVTVAVNARPIGEDRVASPREVRR